MSTWEQLSLFPEQFKFNWKLLHGDCFNVLPHIKNESVDAVITDPPYGVNFKNDFYDDEVTSVLTDMPAFFAECKRVLKPNSYLFIFVGVKTLHLWVKAGMNAGFNFKNILATRTYNNSAVPKKNNFSFQFQPVILFSKGGGRKFNEVNFVPTSELWLKDKRNKNPKEYNYNYPNWIKSEWAYATPRKVVHPNEKNVDLLKFFVEICTDKGDVVLDPFMGSGSTGVACVKTDRQFIGVELDNKWVNVAEERIEEIGVLKR